MVNSFVTESNYRYKTVTTGDWIYRTQSFFNSEETFSINHFPLDTSVDDGGPWILEREHDTPGFGTYTSSKFEGGVTCGTTVSGGVLPYQGFPNYTENERISFGTKAIARSAPTNPAFDFATAFGELRNEGLPAIVSGSDFKNRAAVLRNAGSNYLSVEFGWKPLIRDIRDFAKTVKDSGQILDQYRKGSDRKIRVGYDEPTEERNRVLQGGISSVPAVANLVGPGWATEHMSRRMWFRGAFRYHIPVRQDTLGKFHNWMSMSDHLLGWKVTPETLWNVAPWTWAADWAANTGDILANVSNLGKDGLAMQYGYSMALTRLEKHTVGTLGASQGLAIPVSRRVVKDYKSRTAASPYGFGVDLSSLSKKQIAIIAALGLTKT